MRRGTFLLLAGVGIPVVLLALGWWAASAREAASNEREARALLIRSAEVVRGVVDASLEELRAREDARPFDAWNHVYNPPGVVALSDALALSPLARDPEDKRVIGYFQIDRVGERVVVKTPYEPDPLARSSDRARAVAALVEAGAFQELRSLAVAAPVVVAVQQEAKNEGSTSDYREQKQESIAALNTLQNQVYKDLKEAELDVGKRSQLSQQKVLPNLSRKNVEWKEPRPSKKKPKNTKSAYLASADSLDEPQRNAPPAQVKPNDDTPAQRDDETAPSVEYAPMAFDAFGDDLVLYRLVSSGGSRSVQGAVLNRAQIEGAFLPSVIERHVVAAVRPRVVTTADDTPCSLRAPASDVLEELELCFAPDALSALHSGSRAFEGGLLGLLLVVVGAAVLVTDRAARRAEELSRQKGAFISAISHELRTPLTTLRMHAELLRDNLVGPDRRARFHDDMVRESVRLSHLVENVLEATRLEEGRRPLRAVRADLGAAVRECCEAQSAFIASKGFSIDVDAPALEATFDHQALEQILVNLLDNGAKYAADATDKVLRVEVRDEGARACVRVMDRGPGVPADAREKVFQRFFRVERPGQDHVVGTGLGLALVRELAQAHGGTAVVEDRPGGGCCIAVRLPTQG